MEEINIRDFLNYIKKRWYVITLFTLVFITGILIYTSYFKVPTYTTYTTLVLTQSQNNDNNQTITQNDLLINQKLVYTYSELIKSKTILKQVISDLNLKMNTSTLSKKINVTAVDNTEILKISVTDKNNIKTKLIADDIALVFSKKVVDIYDINNVSIIDKAYVPKTPSNNTQMRDLLIALVLGIISSCSLLFLRFYFDDTIKLSESLEEEIGLPIVGKIFKRKYDKKSEIPHDDLTELIVDKYPKSLISEGIKSLRTNLSFSSVDKDLKTVLITSSIPSEGKSFISINLATAFAQTDKKVLLIDADMRKGRLHKIFKIANDKGLSNLLLEENYEKTESSFIKKSSVKNLSVLTCGTIPPNPSELLNSEKNKKLIEFLKTKYDLIIFDGVPCNGLPDSIIMSTIADKTLVVSSENMTPRELLSNTIKQLNNVNSNIAGVIVNKVNNAGSRYYGKYYSYYGDEK